MNFYNEHDPKAAAWLRELIKHGHLPIGIVDERSIEDITPAELTQYTQCHFFAGIGGWSLALRLAGWPEGRPVWTGSCPCQPFSTAGKGGGFADERHLWPAFHHLISQCQPPVVFGEQVASKDGLGWLDLVRADLEASGYTVGAADLCAASVGAPHIRQRLFWVGAGMANTGSVRGSTGIPEQAKWEARVSGVVDYGCGEQPGSRFGPTNIRPVRMEHAQGDGRQQRRAEPSGRSVASGRIADRLAHTDRSGSQQGGASTSTAGHGDSALSDGCAHGMADANSQTCSGRGVQGSGESVGASSGAACERPAGLCEDSRPSPLHGLWENADWLHCRDGKWRPVESGTFPLAHGVSARVVRLRGYGNAIVPQVAAGFIQAYVKAVDLGQVNQ